MDPKPFYISNSLFYAHSTGNIELSYSSGQINNTQFTNYVDEPIISPFPAIETLSSNIDLNISNSKFVGYKRGGHDWGYNDGGAIWFRVANIVHVYNCIFSDNTAITGGAISI